VEGGQIRWRHPLGFHQRRLPRFPLVRREALQTDSVLALGQRTVQITGVLATTDPPAAADTPHGKVGQRRRTHGMQLSLRGQTLIGQTGRGDGRLDGFLTRFGAEVVEADSGVGLNSGQDSQEVGLPGNGVRRYWNSAHGGRSFGMDRPPGAGDGRG